MYPNNTPKIISNNEQEIANDKVIANDFTFSCFSLSYKLLLRNNIIPAMVLSKFRYIENGIEPEETTTLSKAKSL